MSAVITVENLGKRYILSHREEGYLALRDVIAGQARRIASRILPPLRRPEDHSLSAQEPFWALKDISFKINQGDRVGIIGRNGAGKSTLLKVLSRITEPTSGRVRIRGRVVSLLEVGTGFHPELSGRENIFLNGAILGMTRHEIKSKFDQIVDFAEIERFLDTPVKRYSSGMYVRLAFAVAAHLDPEILIVDEVLAVGDAAFQKKCLGKMEEVSTSKGKTVLFVSHNMQAVNRLCQRSIWLEKGEILIDGPSKNVSDAYFNRDEVAFNFDGVKASISLLPPDHAIEITDIDVCQEGQSTLNIVTGKSLAVKIDYCVLQTTPGLRLQIVLYDLAGNPIFSSYAHPEDEELRTLVAGRYASSVFIPADFLAPVGYCLGVYASIYNVRHCFSSQGVMIKFRVTDAGRIKFAYAHAGDIHFKLAPLLRWETTSKR